MKPESAYLKKLRERENLTQKELADKMGMSRTGLGNIERGETEIGWRHVKRLAKALEKTEEEVFEILSGMDSDKAPESVWKKKFEDLEAEFRELSAKNEALTKENEALKNSISDKNNYILVLQQVKGMLEKQLENGV